MSELFTALPGDVAITLTNGVYRQVDLYTYEGRVFAKHGNGFIALRADGSTTLPRTRVMKHTIPEDRLLPNSRLGYLTLKGD